MCQRRYTLRKLPILSSLATCNRVLQESNVNQLRKYAVFVGPKINYRLHKTPLLDPNLSQMNPGRIYIPCFFNVNFYIIPSSTFRFSNCSLPFRSCTTFCKNVSSLVHYYIPLHFTVHHKITLTTLCDWLTKNSVPIEKPTVAHPVETFSARDGNRRPLKTVQCWTK